MSRRVVVNVLYLSIVLGMLGLIHKLYSKHAILGVDSKQERLSSVQKLSDTPVRWQGGQNSNHQSLQRQRKQTYIEAIEIIRNSKFTPADTVNSENGAITIGMIIEGETVRAMMNILLRHASNNPLHFVILTRSNYLPSLTKRLSHIITKCLATWVITSR